MDGTVLTGLAGVTLGLWADQILVKVMAVSGRPSLILGRVSLFTEPWDGATTMSDPLDMIEFWYGFCLRMTLRPSTRITGCLEVGDERYYKLPDQARFFHPLESVLVGELAGQTSDWMADVEARLGVNAPWIEGFLAGFALDAENSRDQDYVQGYLAAETLRVRRRPRFAT